MLDVKSIFAVLCVSLLALQPLINLKFFYIDTYKRVLREVFLVEGRKKPRDLTQSKADANYIVMSRETFKA